MNKQWLAWQYRHFSPNGWTNIQSKFLHCSNELLRWSANKKKFSKHKLNDKVALLEQLQPQSIPNMAAIKKLGKEIDLWLEQEDVK